MPYLEFFSHPLRKNCQDALRNVQEVYERKYGRIEEISREVVAVIGDAFAWEEREATVTNDAGTLLSQF